MPDNCLGGQTSTLNVENTDCSCVSIASITWNAAGTQFTITLNNGQSITSPVLTGATGPAPTISFRVSGTTLQYSINGGTSWVSIYDLSALTGSGLIWSDATNGSTAVTGAYTTIKTGTTDYTNASKNLVAVGDAIKVCATILSTSLTSNSGIRILFNATEIGATGIGFALNSTQMVTYESTMTLTDATAGAQTVRVETLVCFYAEWGSGFRQVVLPIVRTQDLAGLNFNAANQNFYLQVNQTVASDTVAKEWRGEKYKKI